MSGYAFLVSILQLVGGLNPIGGGMNPMALGMNPMGGGMYPPMSGGMNPMALGMSPMGGGMYPPMGAGMNPMGMNPMAGVDPSTMGAQAGAAAAQLVIPGIADVIAPGLSGIGGSMYERKTQAPMIWIHLRKSQPIIVDREFYNISNVPGMKLEKVVNPSKPVIATPKPAREPIQQQIALDPIRPVASSFVENRLKVDPQMIQNGLYLSQPLRQPAQETINIAAVEDVRSIQATVDYFRKKREIKRLQDRFHDVLNQFINR